MSQASHEFRGSVDFNQNELRNATFQNLITPPVGPKQGQIYFDSRLNLKSPFYWNSIEWIPFGLNPIHKRYSDEASMIADQLFQIKYYIYYRSDEDVYYEYLGTTNGDMSDYNPFGGTGTSNNEVKVIYVNPNDLSGTGTLEEQVCEYINTNIEINYTKQYSKLNIVLQEEVIPEPQEISYGVLYNAHAVRDGRNIANTGWIVPTISDLQTLSDTVGSGGNYNSNTSGSKLKDTAGGWLALGSNTNEFGFNLRGGGLRFDGSGSFSALNVRAVLWSSTIRDITNPDIGNNVGIAISNSTSFLTDLLTTYQEKTGASVRLLKESTTLSDGESGIYVGNDGTVYRTICIGTQEWLADNLIETQYRNGDIIPEVTDNTEWSTLTTGARCFYNNDQSNSHP